MAKEKNDKATRDMLNPNQHGGYRAGAGRKSGSIDKVKIGWHVSREVKIGFEALAEGKDYSPSELLEYLMKKTKKAPKTLK